MTAPISLTSVVISRAEEESVLKVLRSGHLAQGPVVAELERRFAELHGVPHAVAVSNGTVALVAALKAVGIGPGDEVITSPFSFVATLNAIVESGSTARFADVADDFTLDPQSVRGLINERTRALLPVHLYGLPADMNSLRALADEHGLLIVEDAAQAHLARIGDRAVGSWGVGTFSLYATKNMHCGEGGLITTSDDAIADPLRLLRNQGMRVRYQYEAAGHNWRLTDLQAAVALPQLDRLAETTARRAANAERLNAGLAGVPGLVTPFVPPGRSHVWHQYTVRVTGPDLTREVLAKELELAGIGSGFYYPRLMHDYDCFRAHPRIVASDATPRAELFTSQVISLPVHQHLSDGDVDRIVATVREVFGA
jgi:dTDP-4-amino-4,6-dideoxygalactose transaminase